MRWPRNAPVYAMFGVMVLTLLAGWLVLPGDDAARRALLDRLGTSNHGTLVNPAVQMEVPGDGRWYVIVPGYAPCADDCRRLIHISRQVRTRLGRRAAGVQRVLLVGGDYDADALVDGHADMQVWRLPVAVWRELLAGGNAPWERGRAGIWLADRRGLVMMHYGADEDGAGLLEDLRFLLDQGR